MNEKSNTYKKSRHPIKVVATRTGLSKDVIRVWERRYQAISPQLAETGRRLYSNSDIDHLLRLKSAISAGWRISDVAKLLDDEINNLVASLSATTPDSAGHQSRDRSDTGENYLARCLEATEELNPSRFDSLLSDTSVAMSNPRLLDDLISPLLVEIGKRWHSGEFRVGHECLASSAIRHFLDNLRASAGMHACMRTAPQFWLLRQLDRIMKWEHKWLRSPQL